MSDSSFTNCIFQEDWWLDAVAPNRWEKIIIGDPQSPDLAFPYVYTHKKGFKKIHMPQLTQTLGPWIKDTGSKYCKKLAREKDLFYELIDKLPPADFFSQSFHYSITNWLPFYWKEFSQRTLYTYVIEDLTDFEKIWSGFQEKIKTEIRKAQKTTVVKTDLNIDEFLKIHSKTFQRQNLPMPFTSEFIKRVDSACQKKKCRKIFYAVDKENRIHAAIYIIWDNRSAYYLMGGGDPKLRNSGATSLLLWEAIQFCSTVTQEFNFEGSMIENIERFFRAFGARQKPYFLIQKETKLFRFAKNIQSKLRGI